MPNRVAFATACFLSLFALLSLRVSHADEADAARLDAFMKGLDAFGARFEQTLYDADGEALQDQRGTVLLQRPARFRWEYGTEDDDAAGQTLVSDGSRVWLYDPDLEQVTVNAIDERVAGTPLVVLMGDAPLQSAFEVDALGEQDGIDWFELLPISDGDFEAVYVGLSGEAPNESLVAMELRDSFGQATQIRFTEFDRDVSPDASTFTFEAPPGVDVIGAE